MTFILLNTDEERERDDDIEIASLKTFCSARRVGNSNSAPSKMCLGLVKRF